MRISSDRKPETFVPFSITLHFESESEVVDTLRSIKEDNVVGDNSYTIDKIPSHIHRHAKIYYAIKSRGK